MTFVIGDIPLSQNFKPRVAKPLDDRTQAVSDYATLLSIPFPYQSHRVFVINEAKWYQYNGAWNADPTTDFSAYELLSNKGALNGYVPLVNGTIPAGYIPGAVDQIIEVSTLSAFPATGATNKIYVALDTNKTYRWGGSIYTEISPSPGTTDEVPEGSLTNRRYFSEARVLATTLGSLAGLIVNNAISSGNSIKQALGYLQGQINAIVPAITNIYSVLAGKADIDDSVTVSNKTWSSSKISSTEATLQAEIDLKLNISDYNPSTVVSKTAEIEIDADEVYYFPNLLYNHEVGMPWLRSSSYQGKSWDDLIITPTLIIIDLSSLIASEAPVSGTIYLFTYQGVQNAPSGGGGSTTWDSIIITYDSNSTTWDQV